MKFKAVQLFLFFGIIITSTVHAESEISGLVSDAKQLCVAIATEGLTEELKLKGKAKAELSNIIKKFGIDAGIDGSAELLTKKYSSVFQKDLPITIAQTNKCNLDAFKMLKDLKLELIRENSPLQGLSTIRKCAKSNSTACTQLMQFANKATIHCQSQNGGKTGFDLADYNHACMNKAGEVKALVALAENVIQDCGVMYDNLSEKCIASKKVFNKFNSDQTIDILERFMAPVLK